MADPASNQYQDWTGVTVSWAGGSLAVPEVVDLLVGPRSKPTAFYGGGRRFASLVVPADKVRSFTIKGAALNVLVRIPEDAPCTVTGVLNDLANGTGSGAIFFTAVNAVLVNSPFHARNSELGTADAEFLCYSADDSDPFTFAVAP
jgi:hypothetical protein